MPAPRTVVIVGASLAGAKAAETLRAEGFDGRVVLIGQEPERPYERPALSKDYLRGESNRNKVFVHDASFYADQDIQLRTNTTAVALHPDQHTVDARRRRGGAVRPAVADHRRRPAPPPPPWSGPRRGAVPAQPRRRRSADCRAARRGPRRRDRGRLDRLRGRGLRPPARPRRRHGRPRRGAPATGARHRGRRRLPRPARGSRRRPASSRPASNRCTEAGASRRSGSPMAPAWPPISSSSASGPHPGSSSPPPQVSRSTTASSSTPTCAPAWRTSSPPGTWPRPSIR